jgi:hypothetical protein
MKISCLHTLDISATLFEDCLRSIGQPDVVLSHQFRPDLLQLAESLGSSDRRVMDATRAAMEGLLARADAVLLTCSTLGSALGSGSAKRLLRVDEALARQAVREADEVIILYTASTTREPSRLLFEAEARCTGARISLMEVEGAWAAFRRNDLTTYHHMIADAAKRVSVSRRNVVAFAQASMAPAAKLVSPAPMTSPMAGLRAAIAAAADTMS